MREFHRLLQSQDLHKRVKHVSKAPGPDPLTLRVIEGKASRRRPGSRVKLEGTHYVVE